MKEMMGKRDDSCRVVVDIVVAAEICAFRLMLKIINGTCYRTNSVLIEMPRKHNSIPYGFERCKMYYSYVYVGIRMSTYLKQHKYAGLTSSINRYTLLAKG
jgi:hypothetical protein